MNEIQTPEPAAVALTIPCRAEYVGVARLAILGVASRLNFSYDEVEDLRLAVGEACTSAIDRASAQAQSEASIDIHCDIKPSELVITVHYDLDRYAQDGGDGVGAATPEVAEPSIDPENIGALLMEILVDSVDVANDPESGTTVRLTKRVQAS